MTRFAPPPWFSSNPKHRRKRRSRRIRFGSLVLHNKDSRSENRSLRSPPAGSRSNKDGLFLNPRILVISSFLFLKRLSGSQNLPILRFPSEDFRIPRRCCIFMAGTRLYVYYVTEFKFETRYSRRALRTQWAGSPRNRWKVNNILRIEWKWLKFCVRFFFSRPLIRSMM